MVENLKKINIAEQFTDFPAGRSKENDPYSGEKFRKEFLIPLIKQGIPVEIDFDGVFACLPSFLEEAFGGLIRDGYDLETINRIITFTDTNIPKYQDYVSVSKDYIRKASEQKQGNK